MATTGCCCNGPYSPFHLKGAQCREKWCSWSHHCRYCFFCLPLHFHSPSPSLCFVHLLSLLYNSVPCLSSLHCNYFSVCISFPPLQTPLSCLDNVDYSATNATRPFSMSGDGTNDVHIPSVFMQQEDANLLRQALASHLVRVMLTGTKGAGNQEVKQPSNAATKEGERAQPDSNHPDPVSITASVGSAEDSHGADTTQNLGVSQP